MAKILVKFKKWSDIVTWQVQGISEQSWQPEMSSWIQAAMQQNTIEPSLILFQLPCYGFQNSFSKSSTYLKVN